MIQLGGSAQPQHPPGMNPRGVSSSSMGWNRNIPALTARAAVGGSTAPKEGFQEGKRRISAAHEAPSCSLRQLSEAPQKQSWSAIVFPRWEMLLAVGGEVLMRGFWQRGKILIFADLMQKSSL